MNWYWDETFERLMCLETGSILSVEQETDVIGPPQWTIMLNTNIQDGDEDTISQESNLNKRFDTSEDALEFLKTIAKNVKALFL